MEAMFRFLVKNEVLLYVVLGLGALLSFRSAFSAWWEWRSAVFGLEKEMSFNRLRSSGVIFLLLAMLLMSLFCVVSFIVPFLPSGTFLATPTADILFTPLPTLPADVTPGTPTGNATPEGTLGCIPGQLIISSLKAGQEVSNKVVLVGSVDVPNFGFYKYEVAPYGSTTWTTIQAGNSIKREEELGVLDVSVLTPGEYQIRLVVTDNQGAELGTCLVPFRVTPQ